MITSLSQQQNRDTKQTAAPSFFEKMFKTVTLMTMHVTLTIDDGRNSEARRRRNETNGTQFLVTSIFYLQP